MPIPLPPRSRPLLRALIRAPWSAHARRSPAVRRWCDEHGFITPHFSWRSYACADGTPVPPELRPNAVRLHWRLELLRHRLGDVPMTVDGPYRTPARNRAVGGAAGSRHVHADGADFFTDQVDAWAMHLRRHGETVGAARARVLALAEQTFYDGGVGNETSRTLHLDARGTRARFVTWVASR
jgi:hypothetical protein